MTEWAHRVRPQTARPVVAPHRGASSGTHRTTGERPGEARLKRVARTALRSCRTVATGGRTVLCQRPHRAGTFPPSPRTKFSRKWGAGGAVTVGRSHPYQNGCDLSTGTNPRRFFRPFWIAPKGARRRSGETSPKSKSATQNRREGQAPPLRGNGPHMSRNGRPHGAAPTKKPRAQCGANGGGKPPPYVATPYGSGAPRGRALHPMHRKAKRAAQGRPYKIP